MTTILLRAPQNETAASFVGASSGINYAADENRCIAVADIGDLLDFMRRNFEVVAPLYYELIGFLGAAKTVELAASGALGEVQENPTPNTLLDRLKTLSNILGAISGAAVVTDANGTLQQYLRGLVKLLIGNNPIGQVGGQIPVLADASTTLPSGTPTYASGQLMANSATAGSVVPMTFNLSRVAGKGGMIRRVRMRKTGTSLTGASVRLHLYKLLPTCSNGDNGVWLTNNAANYVGSLDVTFDKAFTDGASGNGVPNMGSEINFTSDTYYGLLEARGAYTRAAGEVVTCELEVLPN